MIILYAFWRKKFVMKLMTAVMVLMNRLSFVPVSGIIMDTFFFEEGKNDFLIGAKTF